MIIGTIAEIFGSEITGHCNGELAESLARGKCPDCKETKFLEGPSGGLSTNITCARCRSKFNIGGGFGYLMVAERI